MVVCDCRVSPVLMHSTMVRLAHPKLCQVSARFPWRMERDSNTGAAKADVCGSAEYICEVVLCLFVYLNLWS